MPTIGLLLKADLENVKELKSIGSEMRWYVKVRCSNCNEQPENTVYVTPTEHQSTGRGESNLVIRCKGCRRENTIDIVKGSERPYLADSSGKPVVVVQFDCRGMEPVAFQRSAGWIVQSESGATWEADLSEGDWAEYDAKADLSVGVYGLEGSFERQ